MRVRDQGAFYSVTVMRDEVHAFTRRWPASGLPHLSRLDDEERRLWILNDEGLYQWARSEGVRI